VGNGGRAVLLDFGIARLLALDPCDADGKPLGGPAGAALTPDYASPEQIAGHSVATASDIYSLGVLLFELLTGERPYKLMQENRQELEREILTVEPARPSEAVVSEAAAGARRSTVRSLSKELGGDLDMIILKALNKVPAERYSTAEAFCEDVERYLEGEPIAARRDSGWYIARKFIARHKASVIAATVAMAAALATASVALSSACGG
jgi:serine/threonine protein kinase